MLSGRKRKFRVSEFGEGVGYVVRGVDAVVRMEVVERRSFVFIFLSFAFKIF